MMNFDVIIKNARIDDDKDLVDIGVSSGKISKIGKNLSGAKTIDADGDVVVPSFIESHIHLDKALLERVKPNLEGTLAGAIRITGELKSGFQYEEVLARARRLLEMLITQGTTFVRAHCDTDPLGGLIGFKATLELKKQYAGVVDMQVVAFPQEGLLKMAGAHEILEQAMELGADVVGGCPYNENSYEDTRKHIDLVFNLAKKYDKDLDFHADFGDNIDDLRYRSIDYIIETTEKEGYQGRVSVGHMTSLSSIDPAILQDTAARMAKADINIVPLPATDMYLSGRTDANKVRRGVINPKLFIESGVNVVFSSNNVRNAFTPFGRGDLLMIGSLFEHAAQLGSVSDQRLLLKMITTNAAKLIRVSDTYGLEAGKNADLVILATKSLSDIFLDVPLRRYVMKNGRTIYRSELVEVKNWM